MLVSQATERSPDVSRNEDLVVAGPTFAVVLDGATQHPGVATGCSHDVPWLVSQLGARLAYVLLTESGDLSHVLRRSIEGVVSEHADTCDLLNPDTPSTTVSIVRERDDVLDYLVLADSPIVLGRRDGTVDVVVDDRLDHLPAYDFATVRAHRNAPGGFWVAGAVPEAAAEAVTGSADLAQVACAALFSDGASRLTERHGTPWTDLLALLRDAGPATVIERVRRADTAAADRLPGKTHDDATAVLCTFPASIGSFIQTSHHGDVSASRDV